MATERYHSFLPAKGDPPDVKGAKVVRAVDTVQMGVGGILLGAAAVVEAPVVVPVVGAGLLIWNGASFGISSFYIGRRMRGRSAQGEQRHLVSATRYNLANNRQY